MPAATQGRIRAMEGSAAAPAEAMEAHLPLPQPTDVELILGMRNTFGGTGQWMHQINQMKAATCTRKDLSGKEDPAASMASVPTL